MRLALYQPDIPQNAGALIRLGACLGVEIALIEPCGFLLSDRNFRRSGMDYVQAAQGIRYPGWTDFLAQRTGAAMGRVVLLTTHAATAYTAFAFRPDDTLLLGRESAGVPQEVHDAADARLCIPMRPGLRSLNMAQAAALVLGEGLRQTKGFAR
jgi:tRNA (cytidine/uridine-2'-O-)-methyltransferase